MIDLLVALRQELKYQEVEIILCAGEVNKYHLLKQSFSCIDSERYHHQNSFVINNSTGASENPVAHSSNNLVSPLSDDGDLNARNPDPTAGVEEAESIYSLA